MFQFRLPNFSAWSLPTGTAIKLPKATVHDIEERPEKRARTLKHLLKANHINHSVIYNDLRFHNHTPHILGSADQLSHIYDAESRHLEPWRDSPGEIAKHDWRDNLGKREYQRAYIDFFEDQLVQHGYDWQSLLNEFLLQGKEPLINNLISGLGHPLIHLGYAQELSSRTVAIESLALAACFYNDWHIYLDDPKYTKTSPNQTDSLFTILDRVARDPKFDNLFDHQGSDNISTLLADPSASAAALEHWNSWALQNPTDQFAESQKLAVALLVAAQPRNNNNTTAPSQTKRHDFFAVHLLTTSHAVRILLPTLPSRHHVPLLRQWWLLTLLVYIAQLRPHLNIDTIKLVELEGRSWPFVTELGLTGKYRTDAHFVKALRSMREAGGTWDKGGRNGFYLKAAVKFGEEFGGWGGFGAEAEDEGGLDEGGQGRRRYSGEGDTGGME
ncbi:hypothetical protein LTR35_009390 [Friedmanniomyces endolithicus]|uniref:Apoptosis regulator Bcl-2 family BH4 domain-containing protein n=1 Tax=Friedmanniomyces endolithicus TaxID=329885 RepID=A0AAN6J4L7_9PEZI|nr:hypothetical protein LTR35_009390 [Friedmanniomyces endolithicus]KAK0290734.1 hypothetical protein LTS00_008510 [Friedmanniomyces endolithicus]KAK0314227.1 hypothetical protein LTR82_013152 [Friedmanniomyces endolithicus]KAK0997825.1 hypothetical protein LTR54_009622 [Friedmanniomyces endolithicus]